MRIAKPLLLVSTPIGLVLGIHEAFRLTGGLAFLMIALVLMISAAFGMLVMTIRKEEAQLREVAAKDNSPGSLSESREIP